MFPRDQILVLVDRACDEKDLAKQSAILKELQLLLAEERARLEGES